MKKETKSEKVMLDRWTERENASKQSEVDERPYTVEGESEIVRVR